MHRIVLVCLLGVTVASAADEVDVPNRFQAGTSAVAAEVNANFDALEAAVDDNAADIAALQTLGIDVVLDGVVIGRYVGTGRSAVRVALDPLPGGPSGSVQVAEAVSLANTNVINVLSSTGYRFSISTSDIGDPRHSEGELLSAPVFYDQANCVGNTYFPVEGDTGYFNQFSLGDGVLRPMKRWAARQGVLFASPDLNDVTPVYMMRRGQTVQTAPVLSILFFSDAEEQVVCFDPTTLLDFDVNDPLDLQHTVFALESVDAAETGIGDRLGGAIAVGL